MKSAWKQIAVAVLAGLVVGMAVGRAVSLYQFREQLKSRERYSEMLERFSSQIGLSPDQKSEISEILETNRLRVDALRAEIHPKFEEIRNDTRQEIRRILTEEQDRKFDVMQSEWESRRKNRR